MEEAIRIKFEELEKENNRQNHRLTLLEDKVADLQEMNLNIQRIALNTEQLSKDLNKTNKSLEKLSERIEVIEQKPAQAWNNMTRTIFTTIVSAIAGGLAVAMVQALANTM